MSKISNQRSGKVFQNRVLELLARTSPAIVWSCYSPVLAFIVAYDIYVHGRPAWAAAALFAAGLFVWTLAEYLLHRFVFHFVNENALVQRLHHYAHGYHHSHPRDKEHLFMPVPVGFAMSSLFWGLFWLLIGPPSFSLLPGFVTGYLIYATLHYSMHIRPQAPKALRGLWRHHHMHHFKNTKEAFGVSTTFWDHVFGTMPKTGKAKTS